MSTVAGLERRIPLENKEQLEHNGDPPKESREGAQANRIGIGIALESYEPRSAFAPCFEFVHDDLMIHIDDLEFHYREGEFRLRMGEFSVARSEKVAVIGPSGSGKTTLLKGKATGAPNLMEEKE